jgi:hypothetical protein
MLINIPAISVMMNLSLITESATNAAKVNSRSGINDFKTY